MVSMVRGNRRTSGKYGTRQLGGACGKYGTRQ